MSNNTTITFFAEAEERHSLSGMVAISVVVCAVILLIIVGNVVLIALFVLDNRLRKARNWLLVSLAVSDLIVATIVMPFSLYNELKSSWSAGEILCDLLLSADVIACTASIFNLCAIALDRYWSVTDVAYVRLKSRGRVKVMLAAVWVGAVAVGLPPLVGWKEQKDQANEGKPVCGLRILPGYVLTSVALSFWAPLLVMVAVYSVVVKETLKRFAASGRRRRTTGGGESIEMSKKQSNPPSTSFISNHKRKGGATQHKMDGSVLLAHGAKSVGGTVQVHVTSKLNKERTLEKPVPNIFITHATSQDFSCASSVHQDTLQEDEHALPVRQITTTIQHCQEGWSDIEAEPYNDFDPGMETQQEQNARSSVPTEEKASAHETPDICHLQTPRNAIPENDTARGKIQAEGFEDGKKAQLTLSKSCLPGTETRNSAIPNMRREVRFNITIGVVMGAFVVCWLPFFVVYPVSVMNQSAVPSVLFNFCFWLGYCNSSLNPIIYAVLNDDFRRAYLAISRRMNR